MTYITALDSEADYSDAALAEAGGVGVVVTDQDIARAVQEVCKQPGVLRHHALSILTG